jgi:hypothetical protein
LALATLWVAPAAAQDGKAVFQSWIGKTLVVAAYNGRPEVRFEADGTASISSPNTRDSGRWRLDDNGYCVRWQKLREGREACFGIITVGADTFIVYKGGTEVAGKVLEIR